MSIYITINSVTLLKRPSHPITMAIESMEAVLKTSEHAPSTSPGWKDSLVCPVKEQSLAWVVMHERSQDIVGTGVLRFSSTGIFASPSKFIRSKVDLLKDNKVVGMLDLRLYYDSRKKYLGEIEFYELDMDSSMAKRELGTTFSETSHKIEYDQKKERVNFYKGPCRSKNLFSSLDPKTNEMSFHIMQRQYR